MNIVELQTTFEQLSKVMNLSSDVKLVGIKESDSCGVVTMRFVTDKEVDRYLCAKDITDIGDMFTNPEKYVQATKGEIRGSSSTYNEGYLAYPNKESFDNPYDYGSHDYEEWANGWYNAHEGVKN